jgi:hypothetical protein
MGYGDIVQIYPFPTMCGGNWIINNEIEFQSRFVEQQ